MVRDKISKQIRFETEEECYLREIKEETGIDLRDVPNIVVRKRRINSRRFYKIYLQIPKDEVSIRTPNNKEIIELMWIKIDELKEKVEQNPNSFNSGVRKLCQYNFLQEEPSR
jgi:8-oxo-dGTP pyrophosphatase MutT (NUDIX family)